MSQSLSPEAKRLLATLAQGKDSNYVQELRDFEVRRKWLCVAWLLGASFRQLALLHEVTPATIMQLVNKAMTKQARNAARSAVKLSYSGLSWYRVQFQANVELLRIMEPADAARWLLQYQPFTED